MKKMMQWSAVALAAFAAVGAHAEAGYPSKPITIVVPFTAGGPTDRVARDLSESLRKNLGNNVTIVIDNADGAGSTIGMAKAARAKPEGYTLLLHHIGEATAPILYRKIRPGQPMRRCWTGPWNESTGNFRRNRFTIW